jgi:hypothetical protein
MGAIVGNDEVDGTRKSGFPRGSEYIASACDACAMALARLTKMNRSERYSRSASAIALFATQSRD